MTEEPAADSVVERVESSLGEPMTDTGFAVGEHAFYPVQGVVEVLSIEEKDMGGARQRFYVLSILDADRKVLVPVANATAIGLRKLVSLAEIETLYAHLRDKPTTVDTQTWNRRARAYQEKIKTGSAFDLAEIVRELGWLRTHKTLSFGERRMLDTVKALFVKEIAIASKKSEPSVREEIDALFRGFEGATPS